MFTTAIIAVLIFGMLVVVTIYLTASYVEVPSSVIRVGTTFARASHVIYPGPAFVLRGVHDYYDYSTRPIIVPLDKNKVYSAKGEYKAQDSGSTSPADDDSVDEMPVDVDGTITLQFVNNKKNSIIKVFDQGLAPVAKGCIENNDEGKELVREFIKKFVYAVQSDMVKKNTWMHILYHKDAFARLVQEALRGLDGYDNMINPFALIGVQDNLSYTIEEVIPPEDLVAALPALAIEKQRGEAEEEKARHWAAANKSMFTVMNEFKDVAAIKVMEEQAKSGGTTFYVPTDMMNAFRLHTNKETE